MSAGVADTHTALWYLFGDPRLSVGAKQFIDQAAASRQSIEISPISLAEVPGCANGPVPGARPK
jgi:PIN domain nuclease of toxin-antitoxin system